MRDFKDVCAVIVGGAGLLGRGMAQAFAREGMNIVVADVSEAGARKVADEVTALGRRSMAVATDVTNLSSMQQLADRAYAEFGKVNVLCNNAGVALLRPFEQLTPDDWQRVLSVNFYGVLNGILAFLPRLIVQDDDRHIVNTSSMSGLGLADLRQLNAPYVTSKFAVVGLTETMAPALEKYGIGVSVLCPGMTTADGTMNMPSMSSGNEGSQKFPIPPSADWYKNNVLGPLDVAAEVLHGIRENRLYIFPHRAGLGEVTKRQERILEGFRQAEATSPPMKS